MTKRDLQGAYISYQNSKYRSVDDFYKNCSCDKRLAEHLIKNKMSETRGAKRNSYKFIWGNCQHFTCGRLRKKKGKNYFVLETYANTYMLEIQ